MGTCILTRSEFNPGVRVEYSDELHADPNTIAEEWEWPFPIPEEDCEEFLSEMLATLTEKQMRVITLKFWGGFSFSQIADMTGVTKRAAYKNFLRAMKKMKKYAIKYQENGLEGVHDW